MSDYKRLERKLVYKGAIIDVYCDDIQIPDGRVRQWDFIDHKGAAAMLPVDNDGNIIMVRQYRNSIDRYTLEIPAGGKEPEEDGLVCAMRELEEETGYRTDEAHHLFDLYTTVAFANEKIAIYYTEKLIPSKQNLDDGEYLNVERYTLDELIQMVFENKIQDAKTIAALMAYKVIKTQKQ